MLVLATRMDGLRITSDLRPVGRLSGFLIEPDKAFVRYIVIRSERMGADVAAPEPSFGAPSRAGHRAAGNPVRPHKNDQCREEGNRSGNEHP